MGNTLSVANFDPLAMYQAVLAISQALQSPFITSAGYQQNISADVAAISELSQNPYNPPPTQTLDSQDATLSTQYADFKSKDQAAIIQVIVGLSSNYANSNYDAQKTILSNLLENQMDYATDNIVTPLTDSVTGTIMDGLISLGQGTLLFAAMLAISTIYQKNSMSSYDSDEDMLSMNEKDAQSLGATPDIWELESSGDGKGIMESIADVINGDAATVQKNTNDNNWKTSMGLSQDLPTQGLEDMFDGADGSAPNQDIPTIQNQIQVIFQSVEKNIKQEITNRSIQIYDKIATTGNDGGYIDINRSIYYGETDQSAANNQPSVLPAWTDSSVNADPLDPNNWADTSGVQPTFPVFGTPYNPQTQAISVNMNNQTDFGPNGPIDVDNQNLSKSDGNGGWVYNPSPKRATMFKGWGVKDSNGVWTPDPLNTFTQKTPFSDFISRTVKSNIQYQKTGTQPPGTVKFFIEKLHGLQDDGVTPNGRNPIATQTDPTKGLTNRALFSAYIDSYSESYSPSWTNYDFIGRGEGFPVYKSTTRTVNLTFNIIADYSLDILAGMSTLYQQLGYDVPYAGQLDAIINNIEDWGMGYLGLPSTDPSLGVSGGKIPGKYSDSTETLWQKITFLAQCCYPYYRKDGKMKEQPIIRLRLADIYDLTGYIESLTVDSNEFENSLDLNPTVIGNIPFAVKISMTMKVLHDSEPGSGFYGFYHRREFDTGAMSPYTIKGDLSGGVTKSGVKSKSPMSFTGSQKQGGITDTPSVLSNGDVQKLNDGLQNFQSTFANVNNMGININDTARKISLQNAMVSYVRVTDIASQLASQYGTALNKPSGMAGDITAFSNTTKISNSNASINPGASQIDKVQQNTQDNKTGAMPMASQQATKTASDNQQSTAVKIQTPPTQPKTLNDILGFGGNG